MSDSLPSSCPKRLLSLFFAYSLIFFTLPAFGHNDPHLPRAVSEPMMQLREFIAGYAQNFVGIEYRHGGGASATGFDCSGFTSFALREFGVSVSAASSAQARQGEEISLDAVLPGDLIFFGRRGRVTHVALVVRRTEEGIFCVHSTSSRGIVVENISTSRYWRPKILFARDVITQQAMEKHLLELHAVIHTASLQATGDEMTPECAEEFEQACRSVAPVEALASLDPNEQFRNALARRQMN
ncbi:MAG: hypothetical protein DYG98_19575 [Haliscomenobacteraceae bacterium CHB4]|nr:hypothetical protein [Saprospiraceae bacterium]MCE7925262.1 hypothetical protein [Haliscomenobacteraceae bacterium CHB4]